ncbi:hypothetical protein A3219_11095 [Salmonella enterica]|nr:hypothetical protein A3219_11095 [Salmonella enterica]
MPARYKSFVGNSSLANARANCISNNTLTSVPARCSTCLMRSRKFTRRVFAELQTESQLHQLQLNCLYNTGALRQAFALNHRSIQSVEIQP